MIAHRRLPAVAICALAAFAVIGAAGPARAAEPAGTELFPEWRILDATVTRPGTPPRHLNSSQATAYLQSWYYATVYGTLKPAAKPPARYPVNTVTARESIKGKPYTFVSFYVTDPGGGAYIGVPRQAVIGPDASVPEEKWFVAPPRTTQAFLGKRDAVPLKDLGGGATTTTTATPPAEPSDDSSSDTAGWLVAGGVILVGLVLIVTLGRSRRGAPSEPEPAAAAHGGPDTP
jgi:hypothetical protein